MRNFPSGRTLTLRGAIDNVVPPALQDQPSGDQARNWAIVGEDWLVGQWLGAGADRLNYYQPSSGQLSTPAQQPRCYSVPLGGYSTIVAGGGRWAIQSSTHGVETRDGLWWPEGYCHDMDSQGTLLITRPLGGVMTLEKWSAGATQPSLQVPNAWKGYLAGDGLLWMDGRRQWHALGQPPLPGDLFGLPCVLADGRRFLVNGDSGVALVQWQGSQPLGCVYAGFYFNQDVVALGGNVIQVAASAGPGELPGEARIFRIDVGPLGTPIAAWKATLNGQPIQPDFIGNVQQRGEPAEDLLPVIVDVGRPFQLGTYGGVYGGYGTFIPGPPDMVSLFDHLEVNSQQEQDTALATTSARIFTAGTIVGVPPERRDFLRIGGENADPFTLNQRLVGALGLIAQFNITPCVHADTDDPLPYLAALTAFNKQRHVLSWLLFARQGESRLDFWQRGRQTMFALRATGIEWWRPSFQELDRGTNFTWPPNYLANLGWVAVEWLKEFPELVGYTDFAAGRLGGLFQHPEMWGWVRAMRSQMVAGPVRLPPKPNDPQPGDDDMPSFTQINAFLPYANRMGQEHMDHTLRFTLPSLRDQAVSQGRPVVPTKSDDETLALLAAITLYGEGGLAAYDLVKTAVFGSIPA